MTAGGYGFIFINHTDNTSTPRDVQAQAVSNKAYSFFKKKEKKRAAGSGYGPWWMVVTGKHPVASENLNMLCARDNQHLLCSIDVVDVMQYFVNHWTERSPCREERLRRRRACACPCSPAFFFRQAFCQTCSLNPSTMVLINSNASSDLPRHLHATCMLHG